MGKGLTPKYLARPGAVKRADANTSRLRVRGSLEHSYTAAGVLSKPGARKRALRE